MRVCLVFSIFKLCPWVFMFLFFMSSFWHRIRAYADHASTTVVVATLATLTSISLFIFFLDEWATIFLFLSFFWMSEHLWLEVCPTHTSLLQLFLEVMLSAYEATSCQCCSRKMGYGALQVVLSPSLLSPQVVVETERLRSEKPMQLLYWILKIRL